MDRLVIRGGVPLRGKFEPSGSKNAALPILFASILSSDRSQIRNIPRLADISTTFDLLRRMGLKISPAVDQKSVSIDASGVSSHEAPYELVRKMRASILALGPLLARFGQARVSLPGGCAIGARPVNLHLDALAKLGAEIHLETGYVTAKTRGLAGAEIIFDQISVGATENTLMAATLARGKTVLSNCALEPEICDLAKALRSMGARIKGDGTPRIEIEGVPELRGIDHTVIPDRIEAGTFLMATAITGGDLEVTGINPDLLDAAIERLRTAGLTLDTNPNGIRLRAERPIRGTDITTTPFPGFPTDLQAQFMALMTTAHGSSVITETIFENRFMHVPELIRLGAQLTIKGRTCVVKGLGGSNQGLKGATVMATDIRASASLILAGLAADGETTIRRLYHLDRGYEAIESKLNQLGARVAREKED